MRCMLVGLLLAGVAGCSEPANLQPLIAVSGQYAIMAARRCPTPAPVPEPGCSKGCKCNGTGIEPSGDRLNTGPCRCPDSCECKKRKSVMLSGTSCVTGSCGWPPRNTSR